MMKEDVAVDLEMTGTQVKTDRILEIGACRVRNGEIVDTFHTMVDPRCEIPEYVQTLTGIKPEEVAGAPSQEEAVRAFLDFAGDDVVLGHNVNFDYAFIKVAAVNMGRTFENKALDTLKIARLVLPPEQTKKLPALAKYYGFEHHAHRALADATVTALLYEKLIAEYGEPKGHPEVFEPQTIVFKPKKSQPATEGQKTRLLHLCEIYGEELKVDINSLSRSEASRMSDALVAKYGRVKE